MSIILDRRPATSRSPSSPVGFERTGGGGWKEWDRYLTLNGKPAYHIGNVCNTCAFFFERLEGANQSVSIDTLVDKLASGLVELPEEIVDLVVQILPAGEYVAILLEAKPTLVVPAGLDDILPPGRHFEAETSAI